MIRCLTYLALASALLPFCLHAQQTADVVSGRVAMRVDPAFVQLLAGADVHLDDLASTPLQTGMVSLPVLTGALDLTSLAGEVRLGSGLVIFADGHQIKLISWLLDTTSSSPVLSTLFVVDGVVQGRLALFALGLPSGLPLPLQPQSGTILVQQASVSLAPEGASAFNRLFGLDGDEQLQASTPVGSLDLYAVLASPPHEAN